MSKKKQSEESSADSEDEEMTRRKTKSRMKKNSKADVTAGDGLSLDAQCMIV